MWHRTPVNLMMQPSQLYIKHDQYWQIAYPKIFITQNCIKKGSRNITYLKLLQSFGQYSITDLVIDTFYVKYCSVLTQYSKTFLCKKYISRSFFMQFYASKDFR